MKNLILLLLFVCLAACSDGERSRDAQILLTITGNQTAVVLIYNESKDVLLGRYLYDYNEKKILVINLNYSGVILISALSSANVAVNELFTIQSGKTIEICLLF
jgi:hypothetical protein